MKTRSISIPFTDVNYISKRDRTYTDSPGLFKDFIHHSPEINSIKDAITNKSKQNFDRDLLVNVLIDQYKDLNPSKHSLDNIQALRDSNCFTIITAHQPNLFTGPLYVIYKIISVLNICEYLNEIYPDYQFIPTFISGGEDHDFEEMNHFYFFNNRYEWKNDLSGPVARMNTGGLKEVLAELKERLGTSDKAEKLHTILEKGLNTFDNYGRFNFYLINELFGQFGLVCANMDHPELKRSFIPLMRKELLDRPSQSLIENTQAQIGKIGFKPQAHAREINLFYLQENRRDRIEFDAGQYKVLNTDISFSEDALLVELENNPEKFSPNVVMRPLYQESIFPNLAYVGGGGELAYWVERKSQFEHFGLQLPLLVRRNSVQWIDASAVKQLNKLGLSPTDILKDEDLLIRDYINEVSDMSLDIQAEKDDILEGWERIIAKADKLDPTFSKSLGAEKQKLSQKIDQAGQRLIRIEKQKNENAIGKIRKLKEKLFPANGLQERRDNFIQYYLKYGDDFILSLKKELKPFDRKLMLVIEE